MTGMPSTARRTKTTLKGTRNHTKTKACPPKWVAQAEAAARAAVLERVCQYDTRGPQKHSLPLWHAILSEEVGELAEAILATEFNFRFDPSKAACVREEAIQVAAVALAIVQFVDTGSA